MDLDSCLDHPFYHLSTNAVTVLDHRETLTRWTEVGPQYRAEDVDECIRTVKTRRSVGK